MKVRIMSMCQNPFSECRKLSALEITNCKYRTMQQRGNCHKNNGTGRSITHLDRPAIKDLNTCVTAIFICRMTFFSLFPLRGKWSTRDGALGITEYLFQTEKMNVSIKEFRHLNSIRSDNIIIILIQTLTF